MPVRRPKWLVVDRSRTILGTPRRFGDPSRPPSVRLVLGIVTPVWLFWMTWYATTYGFVEAVYLAGPVLGGCFAFFWLLLFGRWQLYVARYETPGRHPVAVLALRAVGLFLLTPFAFVLGFGGVLELVGWEGRDVAGGLFGVVCVALIAGLGYLAVRRPFLGSSLLLVPPLTLSGACLLAAAILERRAGDHDRPGSEPVRHAALSAHEVPAGPHGRQAPLSPVHRAARPARDPRHPSRAHRQSRPVSPRRGDRGG